MSKHFQKSVVRKAPIFAPRTTERAGAPIPKTIKNKVILFCPFCTPSHPLIPGKVSACGTALQVRAVQVVYKAKYEPSMICAKCQKGGGEMVEIGGAFFHVNDCTPGVVVMTEPPNFSKLAAWIYKQPKQVKSILEKMTGEAMPVDEVTSEGTHTGNVLGYFFKEKSNGKYSNARA